MSGTGARGVGESGIPRNATNTSGALPAGYDYDRDDPTFLHDLRASRPYVEHVSAWYQGQGYQTIVYPTVERPSPRDMHAYRDNGDLGKVERIEVKHRQFSFTGARDYPHKSMLICSCNKLDGLKPEPQAFVIVSADKRAGFIVECRTRKQWHRVTRYFRHKHRSQDVYLCDFRLGAFFWFVGNGRP